VVVFTPEQQQRVLDAFAQRVPNGVECGICHVGQFMVGDGFTFLLLQDVSANTAAYPVYYGTAVTDAIFTPPRGLPLVALTCNHCGNTVLLNLVVLGLGDLTGYASTGQSASAAAPA
jgi:hypothetical protein